MGKILPILLALIGVGAGIGAGVMLKPEPVVETDAATCGPEPKDDHAETTHEVDDHGDDVIQIGRAHV